MITLGKSIRVFAVLGRSNNCATDITEVHVDCLADHVRGVASQGSEGVPLMSAAISAVDFPIFYEVTLGKLADEVDGETSIFHFVFASNCDGAADEVAGEECVSFDGWVDVGDV